MGQRRHVVRLHVDHQPALLEAEVAAADAGRLAHERVGAVGPDQPSRADGPQLVVVAAAERDRGRVGLVDESLGDPAAMEADAVMRARVTVERPLELRLEEQVVGLPPGGRRLLRDERHQRLAVGTEPVVVPQRDHLAGEVVGKTERLQQPHDLVVDVDRPRQPVDLVVALEDGDLGDPRARAAPRAPGRRVRTHNRDVDLGLSHYWSRHYRNSIVVSITILL